MLGHESFESRSKPWCSCPTKESFKDLWRKQEPCPFKGVTFDCLGVIFLIYGLGYGGLRLETSFFLLGFETFGECLGKCWHYQVGKKKKTKTGMA